MLPDSTLLFLIGVVLSVVFVQWAYGAWRNRRQLHAVRVAAAEWAAANPPGPPMTDAQFADFCSWYEAQALPAVRLDVGDVVPALREGSRLGGPAWLPEGGAWPRGNNGRPLDFLAQLDFAELPRIPDFPTSGVLQFFIGRDDLFGANFDDPATGNFEVIWRPTATGAGAVRDQPPAGDADCSPMTETLRRVGRRLTGAACRDWPPVLSLTIERDQPELMRSKTSDRIWDYIEGRGDRMGEHHHVGGYPDFTQDDFRRDPRCADRDRVLLQLWSYPDRELMWGDCGQANFMISRVDLLAREFSRVTYHWDYS